MNCPYCKQPAQWVENKAIYGKNYGKSYMVWLCKPCDAFVGCHGNSKAPLGSMADSYTRKWRTRAHGVFDKLWKGEDAEMTRREAYNLLRDHFGHPVHIGHSDSNKCEDIIDFILSRYILSKPTVE